MSGYYPDGVTGNEFAIAGADGNTDVNNQKVWCDNEDCKWFEEEQIVDIIDAEYYNSDAWGTWTCESCKTEHEWEGNLPQDDGPDYEPEDYMNDADWDY